jgi:anti-sigma28 factor (negative regulator of flagellin synthesis)
MFRFSVSLSFAPLQHCCTTVEYARALIHEFEAGTLNVDENVSLRRFLSKALNCSPKRISKKFEGVLSYNGKQLHRRNTSAITPRQVQSRRDSLRQLERKYKESLQVLQLVEDSRKPTAGNAPGNGTQTSNPAATEHASTIAPSTSASAESSASAAAAVARAVAVAMREARIAKLKADIALASLAFDSCLPRPMIQGPALQEQQQSFLTEPRDGIHATPSGTSAGLVDRLAALLQQATSAGTPTMTATALQRQREWQLEQQRQREWQHEQQRQQLARRGVFNTARPLPVDFCPVQGNLNNTVEQNQLATILGKHALPATAAVDDILNESAWKRFKRA